MGLVKKLYGPIGIFTLISLISIFSGCNNSQKPETTIGKEITKKVDGCQFFSKVYGNGEYSGVGARFSYKGHFFDCEIPIGENDSRVQQMASDIEKELQDGDNELMIIEGKVCANSNEYATNMSLTRVIINGHIYSF